MLAMSQALTAGFVVFADTDHKEDSLFQLGPMRRYSCAAVSIGLCNIVRRKTRRNAVAGECEVLILQSAVSSRRGQSF